MLALSMTYLQERFNAGKPFDEKTTERLKSAMQDITDEELKTRLYRRMEELGHAAAGKPGPFSDDDRELRESIDRYIRNTILEANK